MNKNIKFSIICPVYNSKYFLCSAVKTIMNQTYVNWEFVLIDDGSTDESGEMCDFFAHQDNRIKVVHQENKGQSEARLKGLKQSAGDYILFLDSDDYYETNALELLADELKINTVDAILYNAKKKTAKESFDVYPSFKRKTAFTKPEILDECFAKRTAGYFWTYCFKRELFELPNEIKKKFAKTRYSEDVFLIYQIISKNAESLLVLPKSLYIYNINDESITHTQTVTKVRDRFNVFNEVYFDLQNSFGIVPIKSVKKTIGWTYLSYLHRSTKEYDYSDFKTICLEIRESYIYKKMSIFKKDKFNLLIHLLFRIRMYKMVYSIIRRH